ncbi:MAG TPA: response regulator transcription factor [Chloroflexota bacterium]|nr:response regulator transcription factor [Chloroflexota bacterium]HUM71202.1 response regulator transcription factor [Chloroflexota bacterium]
MSNMRILIVDDQVLFHEGLARLLDSQPGMCVVGGAHNVREAIEKARALQPDVILMDFSLPDGTGLDATEVILKERPSTHIVFLTVHEEDDRLFEAVRYGARGYLLKNIPIQELVAYLHGLERGEPAIHPKLTAHIMQEFSRTPVRQDSPPELVSRLTARQRQILRELRHGASNSQIADCLVLSEQTVKNHVSRILDQLNLRNRHEAAEFARRYNI